jgi:hypothetical protein
MFNLPQFFIWAGYGVLAGMAINLVKGCANRVNWADLFSQTPGGEPLVARYLFFFANLSLAGLFLGSALFKNQGFTEAGKFLTGLNLDQAAGLSSTVYLLSKVSGGDIMSLFSARRM